MIESMSYEEADRWCIAYHATVTFIGPTKIRVQAQGYKPVTGIGFREAVALARRTICGVPETGEEKEIATPLKEAIRCLWNANILLSEAQAEDHDPFVLQNRREDVARFEVLVEQMQEQTTRYVLTGDDGDGYFSTDEGEKQLDLGAIEALLRKGIVHECLECEERADLADCYGGDHREFHLSGNHHDPCIAKVLHEYDPVRWPRFELPDDNYDACEECGLMPVSR